MASLAVLLIIFSLCIIRVYGLGCYSCESYGAPCSGNTTCQVYNMYYPVHCEVAVKVHNDVTSNAIVSVTHSCINGGLHVCSDIPVTNEKHTTFYGCCNEDDYCNRCLIPSYIPDVIKWQMAEYLPPDCNFSVPVSSATPTMSFTPLISTNIPISSSTSPPTNPPQLSMSLVYTIVGLSCVVFVCLIMATGVIICVWCKNNERHKTGSVGSLPSIEENLFEATNMTSGSGAGQRLLEQRTIARQIKKIEIVGKGRYGEVWLGDWGGESVAVKIFSSQDEDSWAREGEVYGTYMLHHDNIAKFIACDKRPLNLGFELWMVMEYHHHGSLLDYLLTNTLTLQQAQSFVYSIASGLHYLHVDIQTGAQIKPGIAHRDLKSKNILVKSNNTCCISDFGLAVRHIGSTGHVDISSINPRQGTKRYMAPEILDGSISFTKFDSYKMVDMYCFGLIIWEIARRTSNRAEEYQLPYYQYVNHDPSMDDMRKVVCVDEVRPSMPSWWKSDELLTLLSSLMQECWRANPSARLSALRVKKNIIRKGLEKFEYKNGFSNRLFS